MSVVSRRESIESPRFALFDFWMVVISGGVLCIFPDFWLWSLILALIPWGFRIFAGVAPVRWTGVEWWLAGFVVTAGAGYWAAYDRSMASTKFILLLMSVLLYFALSSQPEENLVWVSAALFCVGLGISVYFFLTHDFLESPRKLEIVNTIGRWIMQIRPSLRWPPIHPNYVSGIAAIASPFIFYPLWKLRRDAGKQYLIPIVAAGLMIVLFAIVMATSRGVLMAMASAMGVWVLWRILRLGGINFRLGSEAIFPSLVLIFLVLIVLFLYLGPATIGGNVTQSGNYGDGSRLEVFERSAYLVGDFPFTGGGLGSYPALYSHYLLNIPHYYLPNAHNMFLDVFIEQGIAGGLIFLVLYVVGIWKAAQTIISTESPGIRVFGWLALTALIMAFVHGMVDDYLYNGRGAILAMVPLGAAAIPMQYTAATVGKTPSRARVFVLSMGIFLAASFFMNLDRVRATWQANLGAVQMAHVELAGFPTGRWAESNMVPAFKDAKPSLLSSLEADPTNRTANHRLGLIAMLQMDFSTAVNYLEAAHAMSPEHRGISKALGYGYVWLGEFENAQNILAGIPEAAHEIDVYIWWWQTQGRDDLSEKASSMSILLKANAAKP